VGTVFAQNQIVNGTLTVTKSVTLNTTPGYNTTIEGNTTLGNSSSNTITFNGIANSQLDMNLNDILNTYNANDVNINLGLSSQTSSPTGPTTGTITMYNSNGSGYFTIQADNPNTDTWTYGVPDVGNNADFVMSQGAQTISGGKTFTNSPLANTAPLVVNNTHASGSGNNALGATITSTGTSTGGTNTALTLTASNGSTNTALAVTSGNVNIAGLTASKPVFTDANKNLTSTGTIPAGDLPIATSSSVGVVSVDNTTITVTSGGQLTAIGAAPSGAASGDLANMYPNPKIAANQTASTDIATSLNTNAPAAPVNAAAGGTGVNSYAQGDILYAASANPTALTNLAVGTSAQVLGVTAGGVPGWVTNGATITNTTSTSTVSADQTPFVPATTSATYIRISNTNASGNVNVDGINMTNVADGRMVTIANISTSPTQTVTIQSQNNGGNLVPQNQQFQLPGGKPIILGQQGAATFIYDGTSEYWELVSTN
jgi:hypothetical protein